MKPRRKLYELLVKNEIPTKQAKVLACFENDNERLTSWEIQVRTRLQQPQISTSTRCLQTRGWLKVTTIPKPAKGRPYFEYALAHPMREILEKVAECRMADLSKAQGYIDELLAIDV
jgi:predicted transcriptional regulator